ncbi:hypothetical protein EXE53_16715 [Halorubrum sp. SD626R]|uniref:hypothetical protein n=1 Tax=Halorubrum sp. SD626R TaxID=1419722 RepID=UPI0010F488AE|nr:hypothetical protein [Halorubrum sp. SD626R]TKX79270.1 hypothetical protein EXE53_16715 [Halorubrum sp. SD626R]
MPTVSSSVLNSVEFEGINVSTADFVDGKDEEATVEAGDVAEVFEAEIGEDGQLSSYEYLRLGDNLDSGNQDSAKGKLFVDLRAADDSELDQRTEFRFVTRPKNGNRRTPLTEWVKLRNANIDDPSKRLPFTPVSRNGRPAVVKDGRIVAVEVRNPATSIEVDRTNSDADIPARGGY